MTDTLLQHLKTYFGYSSYRPGQLEVIQAAMQGTDSFVLMPTGGGKSLCYQLPALTLPYVTVVVSPLMSLMKDQVDALKANGVSAEFINSSLSREEILQIYARLRQQELKLLYVAPERLLQPQFLDRLSELGVSLIAIDEAHCISQWGHDFRPDYMALSILKQRFPSVPLMALTATADGATRQDIVQQLGLQQHYEYVGSFDRPNIRYMVQEKFRPLEQLVAYLKQQDGLSGIVYCNSRRKVDELAAQLQERGYSAAAYHAGMDSTARGSVQDAFQRDDIQVIVATVAFGMGINKSNIRFVVHYELSRTIESYYQETGRAGRDGVNAEALMLFDPADIGRIFHWIDQEENEQRARVGRQRFQAMAAFAEAQTCRRLVLLNYFGEARQTACGNCDICLSPPKQFDGSELAQKALSCVYRVGQRFGMNHVIEVLRGSQNQKILQYGHQQLSTWGIGQDYSHDFWLSILRQLVHFGFLQQDITQHAALKLLPAARPVLRSEQSLQLAVPRLHASSTNKEKDKRKPQQYDRLLFSRLRQLRKKIAERDNIAPFMVFSDASLIDMCQQLPGNDAQMLDVSGVGQTKLKRYGEDFIAEIEHYLVDAPESGKLA
ncbi:DNA helicase RecQ [Alkalimonas collagenimarina]|uniref:DNA helicase RecQ n=1 Tax=Alkalimonas collagenimarina TaxID=400390 RepID=A0ABT9H3H6_9GAMM|nr:DNA helicase RecQ [Alkalimonas collagenimarina]MDP4537842.1 DNA helicase RecQ [Alkalimonas collagenimarina]